jgi:hypothetical protein
MVGNSQLHIKVYINISMCHMTYALNFKGRKESTTMFGFLVYSYIIT